MYIIGAVVFVTFSSGDVQPWAQSKETKCRNDITNQTERYQQTIND